MSNILIGPTGTGALPLATSIDAVNDLIPIFQNSTTSTLALNRNTFLGISSQPVGISDTQTLTGKTISGASNTITNLSGANLANLSVTATQIANATITATQIANATITATQIANGGVANSNLSIFGSMVVLNSPSTATFTTTTTLQSVAVTIPSNCNKCLVMGSVRLQNQNGAIQDMNTWASIDGNLTETSYCTESGQYTGSNTPINDVVTVTPGTVTTAEVIASAISASCSSMKVMFIFFNG